MVTIMVEIWWFNHINWWRLGELSVIFMVFHPRSPFDVALPKDLDQAEMNNELVIY